METIDKRAILSNLLEGNISLEEARKQLYVEKSVIFIYQDKFTSDEEPPPDAMGFTVSGHRELNSKDMTVSEFEELTKDIELSFVLKYCEVDDFFKTIKENT